VHFRVSGFQALPAEALAKAGFQSFKVSGFASRLPVCGYRFAATGSRKPVAVSHYKINKRIAIYAFRTIKL